MILTTDKGCVHVAGDRALGDLVVDGRITEHDADQVRTFTEFLDQWGPADGRIRDQEQAVRQIAWLRDPDRAAWLGLTPTETEQAITAREAWLEAHPA